MNATTKRASAMTGGSKTEIRQCPIHGEYIARWFRIRRRPPAPSDLEGWTECPICALEAGQRVSAQAQAELAQERQQSSMRQLERRLAGSLIPQRFLGKTFENYRVEHEGQREALLDLQAYADDFADVLAQGRCLLLVGRTGTGKTHLSCAVANSIVRRGYTALFRTVQEVIRHVRSSWGPGGRPEEEAIAELVAPDLLILDEVGVQYGKEAELVTLFDVMNARYSACKPSIVLSNLTLEEIEVFLGQRVMDRLRENGGRAVSFNWESERAKR
ncbi:TPA: ATP-binding protein [Pseudomonas aeruginosa]|nr:ATP-binding protein [Pseudomonas aeruginosa]KPE44014.1 hypothetical protein AOA76_25455 [Pseudomonas aeruginosa]MDP5551135.1 ATP-binding protein [Pseudomonas aeruginosa]MEB5296613.1 ATP-binding protein [Pseudomonas aeruginosa]MEB5365474.1 ATP-binding protein [Pseudomonas aeruginosa]MEB5372080.1 ATP-binding protein [Pseudomonas aeruginosa]